MRFVLPFLVLLAALCLAHPARGEDSVQDTFAGLERSVDPDDRGAVAAARIWLRDASPTWLEQVLPSGPLRGRLAGSFTPEQVRAYLRHTQRNEEGAATRLAAVVENLASRPDLPDLLLEDGLLLKLLPTHRSLLLDLAAVSLAAGDPRTMLLLLRDPRTTERAADELATLEWPTGLQLLADVVTGATPLGAPARAALGRAEPDLQNVHHVRPLGPDRIEALKQRAHAEEDPALRALAARVLLRSATEDAQEATIQAYRDARTLHLEADEWWRVGRLFDRLLTDDSVPRRGRLAALRGTMQFTGMSPRSDPVEAESAARRLRAWFTQEHDPLMRGMLIRELPRLRHVFVDMGARRKLPVPSYRALLEDLLQERAGEDPRLERLTRRVAIRLQQDLQNEPAPHWRRSTPLPRRPHTLPSSLRLLDAAGVARLLAGVEGSDDARADAADHAGELFDRSPRGRFQIVGETGLDLPPPVITGLTRVLADHPDPDAVWLAGEILDLVPTSLALDALLAHAERRWNGDIDTVPTIDVTRHIRSIGTLERALSFVEDETRAPWIRLDLAEALLSLEWSESLPDAVRGELLTRRARWIEERAPLLDGGLAEVLLETWAGTERDAESEEDAERVRRALRTAIARVPIAGPRVRLQSRLLR